MDKKNTARLDDNSGPRRRLHLNVPNLLTAVRSTKFKLPRTGMAAANNNHSAMNGNVELRNVQTTVDLEQNYANLKESLNERTAEVKQEEIVGPTGTVRGFKNIIKARQKHWDKFSNDFTALVAEEDENMEDMKIVFYSTTMGGIRSTLEDCRVVRRIFENHRLRVDERDIFMEKKYQTELDNRLKLDGSPVPQVFINGVYLGGKKEIMELNETGRLITLLSEFERSHAGSVCSTCGGFNFINCTWCKGSKASRKTRISREMSVLKCTMCNENGLQRCPTCTSKKTVYATKRPPLPTTILEL